MDIKSGEIQQLENRVLFHLSHSEISVADYTRILYEKAWEQVNGKLRVYLDTRFWIYLREVALGRSSNADDKSIFDTLHLLVQTGKIICPISFPIVTELTKQADLATRQATATVMDNLSNSICILSPQEIATLECQCFIAEQILGLSSQANVEVQIWRKPFFMHGDLPGSKLNLGKLNDTAINKAWLDILENRTIAQTVEIMSKNGAFEFTPIAPIEEINKSKREYATLKVARSQVFRAQLINAIQEHEGAISVAIEHLRLLYPFNDELNEERVLGAIKKEVFDNLINARWFKRLPSIYVRAAIQTETQVDLFRVIKENDLWDIAHAVVALPYASVFLFERGFTRVIRSKNLHLDMDYGCTVLSERSEILDWLSKL